MLDDPKLNTREYLLEKATTIHEKTKDMNDLELKKAHELELKKKLQQIDDEENRRLNQKYFD